MSGSLNPIRASDDADRAVIFLHGFSGGRDDTWAGFPTLLGTHETESDIYTLGYATTFQPDIVGAWSADPDLPILADMYRTQLGIEPLSRYRSLILVAHSMGGLVAQRALVDDPDLASRVSLLALFGTPSAGLRKASWATFWKRQLENMAQGSEFIVDLRQRWSETFGDEPGFRFMAVAGARDQFVPPDSSLEPFDRTFHRVVAGDHLSMVKPGDADHDGFRLLYSTLTADAPEPASTRDRLVLAAARPTADTGAVVQEHRDQDRMTEEEVVNAALALEQTGSRDEAVAMLERHEELGTDVQGTLAGRMKRLWMESEDRAYADRALELYAGALEKARSEEDRNEKVVGQIYYHAINVAFLHFVVFDRPDEARSFATIASEAASQAAENVWSLATRAEAALYLGRPSEALKLYRQVMTRESEPWKQASASLQASQIAAKMGDEELLGELEAIFTPHAGEVSRIFVSYSHEDTDWIERLREMMQPMLKEADGELELWVDNREIDPGDRWHSEIQTALRSAGVAVVMVSRPFLASDYVNRHELPGILRAAEAGTLRLLWVYVSPAAYDSTALQRFQAAHDVAVPLSGLSPYEQEVALLDIAKKIKEAALSATERFSPTPPAPTVDA